MDRQYRTRGVLWLGIPTPTAFTSEPTNYIVRHHHDNHGPGDVLRVQRIPHGDVDRVQQILQEHRPVGCNEAHLLHEFGADFYGVEMRLLVTGFIREEKDYAGVEELIEDIRVDCEVARKSLDREAWALRETGEGTLDGSWLVR